MTKQPSKNQYLFCCACCCMILGLSLVLPLVTDQPDDPTPSSVGSNFGLANYSYADYLQDFSNAINRGNGGSSELAGLPSDDPRAKALDWIKNDDMNSTDGNSALVTEGMPVALALERFVAATVYYSVLGEQTDETATPELASSFGFLGTDSICNWRSQFFLGIWCNQEKQVEEVSIYNVAGLNGTIPTEIALLQDLEKLHISGLAGSSEMPSEIGNLEKLETLLLPNVGFYGSIPSELNKLYALQTLDLSQNSLNGTLPVEIGDLFAVQTLSLAKNDLNGTLPSEMGFLSALTSLDLSENEFSGPITSEMGRLFNLKELNLNDNDFGGGIPTEMYRLSNLQSLTIHENEELVGSLDPLCNNIDLAVFEGVADCATDEPFCYCCFCN